MGALKEVHVIFDEEDAGGGIAPVLSSLGGVEEDSTVKGFVGVFRNGKAILTKAQAEEIDPKLTGGETHEGAKIIGRAKKAIVVTLETNSLKEAAILAKRLYGAKLNTEKYVTVETTSYKEETAQP